MDKKEDKGCKVKRAEQIAEDSFSVGRNPLDTAGLDTDDEEWLGNNSDYEDYIVQVWKEKMNDKKK